MNAAPMIPAYMQIAAKRRERLVKFLLLAALASSGLVVSDAANAAPSSIDCAAPCAIMGSMGWQASPSSATRLSTQVDSGSRSSVSPRTSMT